MNEAPRTKKYIIPGHPVPWQRAGVNGHHFFDTQKQIKLSWEIHLDGQHDNEDPFTGPIKVDYYFYFPIPRSYTAKRRQELLGAYHTIKPDSDNLIKFWADTATGLLYKDDCIIATGSWHKLYDENPRTEVIVTQLGNRP